MSERLAGGVALVTGAARGIGRAIAERLAQEGASVALADLDATAGRAAADMLQQRGAKATFIPADVADETAVADAVRLTVAAFGSLSILVNNAGVNAYGDATTLTLDEWERLMGVDLKGAWLCCKYAIPHLCERGGGVIINIASVHARLTTYGMFPYAAAKAGLVGMTRSLALDWGKRNIRVVAVSPGWVRTPQVEAYFRRQPDPEAAEARVVEVQPIGRIGTPEDVANLVAFLASDEARYITGTEIVIDGGISAKFAE